MVESTAQEFAAEPWASAILAGNDQSEEETRDVAPDSGDVQR